MVAEVMGILISGAVSVSVCGCRTAGAVCRQRTDRTMGLRAAQLQPQGLETPW